MRELARWLVLVAGLVLATSLLGWWMVPVLGALWGAARGLQSDAFSAGAAAIAAWSILLGYAWFGGPVPELAATMGDILAIPAAVLILLTLVFAGLLAASAAGLAAAVRTSRVRNPAD